MKTKTLIILGVVALALVAALALGGSALAQTPPAPTGPLYNNHCGLTLEEMRAYHDSIYGAGSFDQLHRDGQVGPGMMNGTGTGATGRGMMGNWQ